MGSYDAQGVWRSEMEDFNNYHRLGSEYSPKNLYINADGSTGGDAGIGSSISSLLNAFLSVTNNTYIPDFGKFDFNYRPDDHFNQFGQFLYTDNKVTNNIVIDYVMYGKSLNNFFNIKALCYGAIC